MEIIPAGLTIITSIAKALELHPLTQYDSLRERNEFLSGFKIHFHEPTFNKTLFSKTAHVPQTFWLSMFDEAEKEIMEDEYSFYGIAYSTTAKLAIRRLKKLIDKLEKSLQEDIPQTVEAKTIKSRRVFYHHKYSNFIVEALKHFNEDDEILLQFVFSEWPDTEKAKSTDYVKKFEENIIKGPPDVSGTF